MRSAWQRGYRHVRQRGARSLVHRLRRDLPLLAQRPAPIEGGGTLIFIHIPKTGGTAMRQLLEERIPAGHRIWVYDQSEFMTIKEFGNLPLRDRRRARLVMGHFFYGLHEALPQPARYVTMLRDPVTRVVSHYEHLRRDPMQRHHRLIHGQGVTLYDYLSSGIAPVMDNLMVRHLSGQHGIPVGGCTQAHLDLALANIGLHFSAVLLMERMEESRARLEELLNVRLGPIPEPSASPTTLRVADLAPAVVTKIEELNHLDRALYEHVAAELRG